MAYETILKDLSTVRPKWTPSQGRKSFPSRNMSALEREIDGLLYELTEEEVVIIEKSN